MFIDFWLNVYAQESMTEAIKLQHDRAIKFYDGVYGIRETWNILYIAKQGFVLEHHSYPSAMRTKKLVLVDIDFIYHHSLHHTK